MEELRNPPQKQPRTTNQVLCGLNAYVLKKIKLDSKLSPPSQNPPEKQPRTTHREPSAMWPKCLCVKKIKLSLKLSPPSQNPPEKQPRTTHREPSAMWPKCLCVKKNKIRFKIIPTKSKSTAETIANHAPRTKCYVT